jgi:hypothetical protein
VEINSSLPSKVHQVISTFRTLDKMKRGNENSALSKVLYDVFVMDDILFY